MMRIRCNFFKSICIMFCLVYFTKLQGCAYNQFQCSNGYCISLYWKCDGDFDCSDHSDEDPTKCSITQFPTTISTITVIGCHYYQFQCSNIYCIPLYWQCDGRFDCSDHSDEDPTICQTTHLPTTLPTPRTTTVFGQTTTQITTTYITETQATTVYGLSSGSIILISFGVIFSVFLLICFAVCFRRKKRMQPAVVQLTSETQNTVRELVPTQFDFNSQMGVVNMSHVNEPPPPYEPTVQVYTPSNDLTDEPPPSYNDLQVNLN
ncbi:CD320 antigen-like [Hydra vulgaris]|uniref:CD320 antigen-like n=1 Tax=Hydra vulgaris TaxID=6087 RepID=A0ABM4BVX8_HYDVU